MTTSSEGPSLPQVRRPASQRAQLTVRDAVRCYLPLKHTGYQGRPPAPFG
jgi:hypothetical protein